MSAPSAPRGPWARPRSAWSSAVASVVVCGAVVAAAAVVGGRVGGGPGSEPPVSASSRGDATHGDAEGQHGRPAQRPGVLAGAGGYPVRHRLEMDGAAAVLEVHGRGRHVLPGRQLAEVGRAIVVEHVVLARLGLGVLRLSRRAAATRGSRDRARRAVRGSVAARCGRWWRPAVGRRATSRAGRRSGPTGPPAGRGGNRRSAAARRARAGRRRRRSRSRGTAAGRPASRTARRRARRGPSARRPCAPAPAPATRTRRCRARGPAGSGPAPRARGRSRSRPRRRAPESLIRTLPGFRSRCTQRRAWAAARPFATWIAIAMASVTAIMPSCRNRSLRSVPSISSNTRNGRPSISPRSSSSTVFGFEMPSSTRASRSKRAIVSGESAASRCSSLTATWRPDSWSRARHTEDEPPDPRRSSSE